MLGLYHDPDTNGIEVRVNGLCDLAGQTLLDREATGKAIDQSRNLRQADNLGPWDIPDRGRSGESQ